MQVNNNDRAKQSGKAYIKYLRKLLMKHYSIIKCGKFGMPVNMIM